MLEKFIDKFWALIDFFEEFPKVFYLMLIYLVLIGAVIFLFFPCLNWLANLQILNTYPLFELISNNFDALRWGVVVIPLIIAVHGVFEVIGLHDRLKKRKYGR
ncbi:hypothetical protein R4646_10775 [Acinetobacter baumannii]|uniref:hypothetical protein n=1 Tax=Acinetobacter baumannii TaxID=470 RepID=UPI00244D04BD|nr:hypothetical protein [Acinetobacter baumannii]MDH2548506.1 hypothetical protein [Acinetobacter baumannii]MDO7512361.1 hypothetical protein [Acinetobacter baumannii]MDV7633399.1 hypothetical protein [Acinetobacter baumannii]MDV7647461.1 hypothetical protein [Acinetobacter baumannii]